MPQATGLEATPQVLAQALELKIAAAAQALGDPSLLKLTGDARRHYVTATDLSEWYSGFGYGLKISNGSTVGEEVAVRYYLRKKLPRRLLSRRQIVPKSIGGVPTDVIEAGGIFAHSRPVPCGSSVSNKGTASGTIACLARKRGESAPDYLLSNYHVLARMYDPICNDEIVEPGATAPGSHPRIGGLAEWLRLDSTPTNEFDAAIARVDQTGDVLPEIEQIGPIQMSTKLARLGDCVQKYGTGTKLTQGVIVGIAEDLAASVGARRYFIEQVAVAGVGGAFTDFGDSGALVVDVGGRPIGLHFAGTLYSALNGELSFCNPIQRVLDHFGVDIVS